MRLLAMPQINVGTRPPLLVGHFSLGVNVPAGVGIGGLGSTLSTQEFAEKEYFFHLVPFVSAAYGMLQNLDDPGF